MVRVLARDVISANSLADVESYEQQIYALSDEITAHAAEFETAIVGEDVRKVYEEFVAARVSYVADLKTLIALGKENRDEEATALLKGQMSLSGTDEDNAINSMVALKIEDAGAQSASNNAMANSATIFMLATLAVCTVIAFVLGEFISKAISKPVGQMVQTAEKIADGDLDVEVAYQGRDEIGQLANAFRRMSVSLNEAMASIRASSEQVASGAEQVSTSGQALSQGSTEQASSIEEITSSMTQVAAQTKQNAVNAGQANELAVLAKQNAVSGNSQMQEMLKAMTAINESSSNISKIIKVIDDIAFQTNILAPNAAVEAARAGQHGKGFAVVAEEVRTLAARSAGAAKETTGMIEGSIQKVEIGTKLANETAVALNNIVGDVSKAADIVGGIAAASNEQASAIAQVNIAIEQVSQVVQTNSATAEESAAASEELSGQAQVLREVVAKFKLKSGQGHSETGDDPARPQRRESKAPSRKIKDTKAIPVPAFATASGAGSPDLKINLTDMEFGKY
jgi:methyl-accepting chemotaxis protein